MNEPYEIEFVRARSHCDSREAMFATLTGLSKAEIGTRWPAHLLKDSWPGRNFIEAARSLGFNCNPRFVPFKKDTPWPCVLRIQVPGSWGWGKGNWWALLYHQGKVMDVLTRDGWGGMPLKRFEKEYRMCRITSMLQVWMSTNQSLSHER